MDNNLNQSSTSWHSYPKIYNFGHRVLKEAWAGPWEKEGDIPHVVVEEKIDGSQLSFGVFDGEIRMKSKNVQFDAFAPTPGFELAAKTVRLLALKLIPGWTYRGEYLSKPKHNALAYDRVPEGYIIIFDINDSHESYLPTPIKQTEALRIGLDCVPTIFYGRLTSLSLEKMNQWLQRESCLGGPKIEGVVAKTYDVFGPDKKVVMAKHVSEQFKEVHRREWAAANPKGMDIVDEIGQALRTEARWEKAVQWLAESGNLMNAPQDIGALVKRVQQDISEEEEDWIKDRLYAWAKKKGILRISTRGLPEWYKNKLIEKHFGD